MKCPYLGNPLRKTKYFLHGSILDCNNYELCFWCIWDTSNQPNQPNQPTTQKFKKRHNFQNICPIWLKFCTVVLSENVHSNWALQEDSVNFCQVAQPAKKAAYREFFKKIEVSIFFSRFWSDWTLELWFSKIFTFFWFFWLFQLNICFFSIINCCISA